MKMNHRHQLTRGKSSSKNNNNNKKPETSQTLINMATNCSSRNSKFIFLLWLPVLLLSMVMSEYGNCAKLPDIYWNSSNPIFRIDNTDHIFDVNKKQHDHDQVDIVCPQPATQADGLQPGPKTTANSTATDQERYIIYSVSKEEYDTCRLNGRGRVVAVCDSPEQPAAKRGPPVTITFRSFTPQPNGLEFAAGQDYYFISALFGHHHDPQRRFSPCREHNMKVIFKVCCKSPSASASTPQPAPFRPAPALSRSLGPQSQANQLGRRPASPVITLRPALPKLAEPNAINSYFDPLPAGSPFGSTTSGQAQPITVLPIEVLSSSNQEPSSSVSSQPTSNDLTSKDDMLAEQPQTQTTPQPPPPPPPPSFVPSRRLPANSQPNFGFRFNQEEQLRNLDRWAPTPLPGELHRKQIRMPPQHQQQPQSWLDQSGWPAQYQRSGSANLAAGWNSPAASRGNLYWNTFKPSYEPPMKDLMGVQGEEGSSSSAASNSTPTILLLLLLFMPLLELFAARRPLPAMEL